MRDMTRCNAKKMVAILMAATLTMASLAGCSSNKNEKVNDQTKETEAAGTSSDSTAIAMTSEEIIKKAASEGKVGNWGLGNEYEVQALLTKYGQPITYLSQAFDMDGFDDDSITLASAMTFNELGLVKNSYDGGYNYGDTVGTIDMNDEGVAMLEDNIFCTRTFAEQNPNTVKAFIYASMKGWKYACENPEEAAEIVYKYGSSVSSDHQAYMASEVKKLVETDTKGNAVSDFGKMDEEAMSQTLELAKKYISLDDATAADKLSKLTLDDVRDTSYWEAAEASTDGNFGTLEKTSVKIQLKWLPQAQFMGYYVALEKGYYSEVGLEVEVVPGGGDISETTAVTNGTVDFGVTWVANLIAANAGGMDLLEVSQVYQRSGLVLVYKLDNFTK
ncbi:ABC transporter substrate-binding protein [Anaerosporobacter sp.]